MPETEAKNLTLNLKFPINVRYDEYLDSDAPDRTLVLLHGYGETKERIYRKLAQPLKGLAQRMLLLNAPFPAPQLGKEGFKEGYAWYFRSLRENLTIIPPEACEVLFQEFVKKAKLSESSVTLVGFSQGGFILPYLARQLPKVQQMIGISCGVHSSNWPQKLTYTFNIVHADKDPLSDVTMAEQQFSELGLDRSKNQFKVIPGGHEIDAPKIDFVRGLLNGN